MLCAGIKAGTPLVRVYSDLKQESHKPKARFHASLRKVFPSVVANLRSPLIAPGPKHLLFHFPFDTLATILNNRRHKVAAVWKDTLITHWALNICW